MKRQTERKIMNNNSEYGKRGKPKYRTPHSEEPKFGTERVVTKSPAQYITKPARQKSDNNFIKQIKANSETSSTTQQVREYPAGLQFFSQISIPGQNKVSTSFKITDDFNLAKHEAIEIQGWKLWKNKLNKLVVVPVDDSDKDRRYYTFNYEPGFIYFVQSTSPNQIPYVYFRGIKFQEFVEKYKINKVIRKDPNGLIAGRQVRCRERDLWSHEFSVFTTGSEKYSSNKDLSKCIYATLRDIPSKEVKCIEVSGGARMVIVAQSSIDENGKLTVYRTLITSDNMYDIEPAIKEMSQNIDMYFL